MVKDTYSPGQTPLGHPSACSMDAWLCSLPPQVSHLRHDCHRQASQSGRATREMSAWGAPYAPCSGIHQRAICIYGVGDLHWILQNHHLLANKFDPRVDDNILQCLEEYFAIRPSMGLNFELYCGRIDT